MTTVNDNSLQLSIAYIEMPSTLFVQFRWNIGLKWTEAWVGPLYGPRIISVGNQPIGVCLCDKIKKAQSIMLHTDGCLFKKVFHCLVVLSVGSMELPTTERFLTLALPVTLLILLMERFCRQWMTAFSWALQCVWRTIHTYWRHHPPIGWEPDWRLATDCSGWALSHWRLKVDMLIMESTPL